MKIVRPILIAAGILSVGLGIVGMFVPLLPTTPFLLLAAFFFVRSSERFHYWLLNNRFCGEYIRNYQQGKGIPLKQKVLTIALLWLSIIVSGLLMNQCWIRLLLLGVAIGVTIHLVKKKTAKNIRHQPATRSTRLKRKNQVDPV